MDQETLASGRYVLDRVIGAGGMADVYRARDTRLHRDVAVKMFRRGSAEGVARGSAEARMLAALHHPGLVRVLDMDAECIRLEPSYLVMEYVKGPDLGSLLREGALPPERTTTAALDIARTLEYIHGCGIVHRDIKPSNVLTRTGDATDGSFSFLLTDFGIARFFESSRVTATGSLIGTATYFSPEQARGDRVGTPTDVYALGLVLIECLTGEPAFPGTGLESALARLSRPPVIPDSFGEGWYRLLTAMTLDNPLDRPTAAEVVRSLNAPGFPAVASTPETTTTTAPPAPTLAAQPLDIPRTPVVVSFESSAPCPQPVPSGTEAPLGAGAPLGADAPLGTDAPLGANSSSAAHPMSGAVASGGAQPDVPLQESRDAGTGLRGRVLAVVVVLVGLTLAVLLIIFDVQAGPGPNPLPTVPGSTGALLDSLYESVQP